MQRRAADVGQYLSGLLDFGLKTGSSIFNLPLDLLLDEVFLYLFVEDILTLRRVNKAFFILTHEPIIWKRFLQRMDVPLPPLRPTFRWSLSRTDYEIEQLVTQALTADDNWRRADPRLFDVRRVSTGHYRLTDMYLLPGGRYLITSCQTLDKEHFHLAVWALDHPAGPRELARIPTLAEAFRLEAKVMNLLDGEQGLIIAYVRRIFNTPQPSGISPSDYSWKHPVDVPGGFSYEAMTIYTSFTLLEQMSNPDLVMGSPEYNSLLEGMRPPFQELGKITCPYAISQLSLFELEGDKVFSALCETPGGGEIYFSNIQDPMQNSTLRVFDHFPYTGRPYKLRAFRVFPNQKDMIIIRTVTVDTESAVVEQQYIEWVDLPEYLGHVLASPKVRYAMEQKNVSNFRISDYGLPGRTQHHAEHPTFQHALGPPPPISVFVELEEPNGCEHHAIYPNQIGLLNGVEISSPADPDEKPPQPTEYSYRYEHETFQMTAHLSGEAKASVLAGSHRAILCTLDGQDKSDHPKIVKLRRYIHPEISHIEYAPDPAMGETAGPVHRGRLPMPKANVYRTFDTGDVVEELNRLGGVQAMCWDEATGRTIMAPHEGGMFHILEFSKIVAPDSRIEEWKWEKGDQLYTPHPLTMPGCVGIRME
ncbi:hypothetical protein BKA70DRAFT_1251332 [Coprinopsis sp. MPI-PUGE-AT-0042]|nr:hypothetical protein BKA70DRAFT_1251332 [Coprinopsis sp. MPI-PUGE-AT-0042]